MPLTQFHSATDVGLQRSNNEDCFLNMPMFGVWAVADGMGGHAAGEVASAIACDTLRRKVTTGSHLKTAVQASHRAILAAVESGRGGSGMGSTLVALQSSGNQYEICWVGDSRAYSFYRTPTHERPDPLLQLTHDHSYVQLLVDSGVISREEMLSHPEKNIITQCLGSTDLERVEVDTLKGQWQDDEWLLLCSDGLSDAVSDDEITTILQHCQTTETATTTLIAAALNNGGRDNITVQIVAAPSRFTQALQNAIRAVRKIIG
ncbi:PP2C family protein-serine/threonine phosphatase [Teredinibacter purpureus]|uniref:PP2C family protein-serine/threonine phosphatase n=1 Tax=Teredinibacter purpureus TaxID=2731756 RepID=UPI0005F7C87E|nr:protein phosphatase 2C domain-containing protein [Teredinibacter purpureus]